MQFTITYIEPDIVDFIKLLPFMFLNRQTFNNVKLSILYFLTNTFMGYKYHELELQLIDTLDRQFVSFFAYTIWLNTFRH